MLEIGASFSYTQSLLLTDRKQDNKTWHKESERKESREKKEKSTKWKMKWEKLIGLLWDLKSPLVE